MEQEPKTIKQLEKEKQELLETIENATKAAKDATTATEALLAKKDKAKAEEKPAEAVEAEKPAEIAQPAETAKEEKPIINKEEQTLQQYEKDLKEAMKAGDLEKMKAIQNEIDEKFIKTKESTTEPTVIETKEEKSIEEKLNDARNEYAIGYKKFLSDRKKSSSWFTNASRKIFGSKVKEEDTPQFLKDLEKEYEKATVEYGKKMYAKKEEELKDSKLSVEEQKAELKRYKSNEIFTKVIIEEQTKLNALKADNLPVREKGIWKKLIKSYIDIQPRWKKIAISVALSTAVMVAFSPTAVAAGGGVAFYAGQRLVRSTVGVAIGVGANKAYDLIFKEKSATKRADQEKELSKMFAEDSFDTSFAKNKKEYSEIIERERKAKRERLITKSLITLAAGGLASYGMGSLSHTLTTDQVLSGDLNKPNIDHTTGEIKTGTDNFPKHDANYDEAVKKGFPHEEIMEKPKIETEFSEEKVEISSKGAIQTIEDLKEKIRTDYNNDFSKAPASVQEFMKTNSTEEAIKLGFYNPNAPEESAMMLKGSTLGFDEHGNLTVHDIKTGEDSVLIHGEGTKPQIEKYHGQMFDSDKNIDHTHGVPDNQNEYAVSEQVNPITGEVIDQNNPSENIVPEQINPVTGEVIDQNNINNPVEIGGNTYGLTPEQVAEVNQVNEENINHLFGDKTTFWDNVKDSHQENLTADKMMHMRIYEGLNEDTKNLVSYLNKLHEVTGLNPIEGTLINTAETNSEYIERALLKAEEMGQLDKVKL